ncbi:Crp/Fnr family transcriptional regulator [Rapidithrix thailandica]|uniref:Crp/Fnr family transcriptional regulator n=1 Tax=Rapidithrix thailandica TaxID=413964 RepID=A0AAW9S773_9BACT
MHPNLIQHIRKYVNIREAETDILWDYIKPLAAKKKDFLLQEGQVCKSNFFVEKGCLRMFFINEKGTEQITDFAIENWWMADYMSFLHQAPSSFYIQAIEKSTVYCLFHHSQNELFAKLPQLERYFRLVSQRANAASQYRIMHMYNLSREELYHHFSTSFPEFVQRVPQYMLASFLGFTPEYLSEIRKKKT